ncbi:putative ORFan [Tupanvirus deep ocean]|uniref:ORFan n=2 Tax=Tupanvirus TaxID=2094720 RepID=A0AC62A7D0_9VIRU|nr:putative ORFan [Tupanvirus deep ocean]QKU33682.1 putative ORFan [Tupanvirus deep ocean]
MKHLAITNSSWSNGMTPPFQGGSSGSIPGDEMLS